jgi:hypothetical protein
MGTVKSGGMTEASRLFDEFNARYSRGRLPRYRVFPGHEEGLRGWCRDETKAIMLDRTLTGEDLQMTLLHEMAHIGTGGAEHGPQFQLKLRRLLRLGAPARLLEHLERYDGTAITRFLETRRAVGSPVMERPFRVAVREDLEAMAFDTAAAKRRWVTIERVLVDQYDMTAAQLRRACPWAEREWRRLSAEARQEIRLRQRWDAVRSSPGR